MELSLICGFLSYSMIKNLNFHIHYSTRETFNETLYSFQVSDIHQFHTRNYGYQSDDMDFSISSVSLSSGGNDSHKVGFEVYRCMLLFVLMSAIA